MIKTNAPSFRTHFWGKDERGSEVVVNKMNQGAKTCDELVSFYKEKIRIEENFARDMMALSRKSLGAQEFGDMRSTFEVLRQQTTQIAHTHLKQAKVLKNESLLQLETYLSNYKGRRMPIESSIESLRASKKQLTDKVLKLKENYRRESAYLKTLLANDSVILGKQAEKSREKQQKQQQIVDDIRQQYQNSVEQLSELNKAWIDKWKASSAELEQYEMERVSFLVENLWEYSNNISTSCVNDDLTCENVRQSLEKCDPIREVAHFTRKFATGSEIYSTPGFIDFSNGESDVMDAENGEAIQSVIGDARKTSQGLSYMSSQSSAPSQQQKSMRLQSQHTVASQKTQSTIVFRDSEQQSHINQYSQFDHLPPVPQPDQSHPSEEQYHAITRNTRKPPPSETGQTAISNPSDNHSLGINSEASGYSSNPTTISDFTASIDEEHKIAKNWNSPMRRRSRSSLYKDKELPPVIIKDNLGQSRADFEIENLRNSMNGLRYEERPHQPQNSFSRRKVSGATLKPTRTPTTYQDIQSDLLQSMSNFSSSMMSAKSNDTTKVRPKSMFDFSQSQSQQISEFAESSNSFKSTGSTSSKNKRSSFHSGLRSMSRSSLNLTAKINSNGLPIKTSDGRRVIRHAKALYNFTASIDSELSFQKDDILLVINKQEDNWWECERLGNGGGFGLVPYNYVEEI